MAQMQAVTRSTNTGSMKLQRCSPGWYDRPSNLQKGRFLQRRPRQRRGVLLLVCLVLLVMFLMLGVTFVLTAGNFRRSSEAYQRMLERPSADLPERSGDLLDSVAHDLVRGTSSQDSPFSEENLLEDLYGRPALRGVVSSATDHSNGDSKTQLTSLTITADGDFTPLPGTRDYYAGQVLTFLTGTAQGRSTRIVGWDGSDPNVKKLTIVSPPGATGLSSPADLNNSHFLVNGRPFSGDGSGNGQTSQKPRLLNEDYDKADANNPWLTSYSNSGDNITITPAYNSDAVTQDASPQVDNDGDGQKDSVWIDTGLPLQLQPDGSYVKPLVAMMVRDLDSRVNLNAHGSIAQQAALQTDNGQPKPLGQGYGPAEIDPFNALDVGSAEFDITNFLGLRLSDVGMPASGTTGDGTVPNDQNDQQDFSGYYQYGSENAVVTPLDPHGQSYAEEDDHGSVNLKTVDGGDLSNNFSGTTYDLELDTAHGIPPGWHAPYIPNDLERVLRFSDADADGLNSRLYEDLAFCLNGSTEMAPDDLKTLRERITTESWDLPVAGLSWLKEMQNAISGDPELEAAFPQGAGHITDFFAVKFYLENKGNNPPMTLDDAKQKAEQLVHDGSQYRHLIAPGLMRGTRFNVNRLLGNGEDDNGNNVVDEPSEALIDPSQSLSGETITAPSHDGIKFDHDGDGSAASNTPDPDDKYARQHYAQQLYLLLMLLADDLKDEVPAGSGQADKQKMLARRLAQFAVNAVDYRDPDSIMTGFEYDANPFDAEGWLAEADGDLSTAPVGDSDYGVVWGCEAPVAALSGTFALHDLRLRDLEVPGGKTTDFEQTNAGDDKLSDTLDPDLDYPFTFKDNDYDQYAPPEGSLFLQIYALPQNANANLAMELFSDNDGSGNYQLDLARTHNRQASGDPVWRVAISEPHPVGLTGQTGSGSGSPLLNQLMDHDGSGGDLTDAERAGSLWNPLTTFQTKSSDPKILEFRVAGITNNSIDGNVNLERVIYFTPSIGNAPKLDEAYLNQDNSDMRITPGSATLVGPRQTTKIRSGGTVADSISATVVCTAESTPSGWSGSEPIGMSVSEPVTSNYYNDTAEALGRMDDPMDGDSEIYVNAAEVPFDKPTEATGSSLPIDDLLTNSPMLLESNRVDTITDDNSGLSVDIDRPQIGGKINNYCTAFLQRLADPTQAYDATSNPYVTVDLMPVDLTVFNGDDMSNAAVVNGGLNAPSTGSTYTNNEQIAGNPGWRSRQQFSDVAGTVTSSTSLNPPTAFVSTSNPAPFWPNRPFVSQYELLMVPASEPGKLALELGSHRDAGNFTGGFPHLLNFFFQASGDLQLGRVFDYLHVPSKYTGTQVALDPGTLSTQPGFAPPFNVISTYREPGRVNLNTIEHQEIWDSVMNGMPGDATTHQGPNYSTLSSQTFHGAGEVNAVDGTPLSMPLLRSTLSFEGNSDTNPFLRYQPINRMGNLVTNRSNVYAVWMTLGFFETDKEGDLANPPVEAGGSDLERHRAFYMIDRSIPVGYENGYDHNTEEVFRLKRFIE